MFGKIFRNLKRYKCACNFHSIQDFNGKLKIYISELITSVKIVHPWIDLKFGYWRLTMTAYLLRYLLQVTSVSITRKIYLFCNVNWVIHLTDGTPSEIRYLDRNRKVSMARSLWTYRCACLFKLRPFFLRYLFIIYARTRTIKVIIQSSQSVCARQRGLIEYSLIWNYREYRLQFTHLCQ